MNVLQKWFNVLLRKLEQKPMPFKLYLLKREITAKNFRWNFTFKMYIFRYQLLTNGTEYVEKIR